MRRKRLAYALVAVGGIAVIAAVVLHTVLVGSVLASVDVGNGVYAPLSVAVDSRSGVAYVGRQDGAVTLLDTHTGAALRTIATAGRTQSVSVAVAPGLRRVYLAHGYSASGVAGNELEILDARTRHVLYRRTVRNLTGDMAVDEPLHTLFVATQTGVSRLDARTGRLLGWTWSSGPNGLVVDRRTQHVFVPVGGRGSVTMLDARSGRVLRSVAVASDPHYIALDERLGRVYVLSYDTTLSVVDARTGKLLAARPLRPFAGGFVGYTLAADARAGRVVVCEGQRVHVLDGRTLAPVAVVDLGHGAFSGDCAVAVGEAAGVAYVSSPGGFKAIDTRSGAVLSSQGAIALSGGQVAVDAASHHVLVGGPHLGAETALGVAAGVVNGVMHRQFWLAGSDGARWSVSTLATAR